MTKKANTTDTVEQNNPMMDMLAKIASGMEALTSRLETLETKTASIGINTRVSQPQKATAEELVKMAVLKLSDSQAFMYIRDKITINGIKVDPKNWNRVAMDACIYANMLGLYKSNMKADKETPETIPVDDTTNEYTSICENCVLYNNGKCRKILSKSQDACFYIQQEKTRKAMKENGEKSNNRGKNKKAETKAETDESGLPALSTIQAEIKACLDSGMNKKDTCELVYGDTEASNMKKLDGQLSGMRKKGYNV